MIISISVRTQFQHVFPTCSYRKALECNSTHMLTLPYPPQHTHTHTRTRGCTCAMTSWDQMSEAVVMLRVLAISDSEGRSRVGPNTVARLCRDILLMGSFSATLQQQQQQQQQPLRTQREARPDRGNTTPWTWFHYPLDVSV